MVASQASCIYEGRIRHRRFTPRSHAFGYRLFMMYLDLAELPELLDRGWLWSPAGRAWAAFRRADHLLDAGVDDDPASLEPAVRELVTQRTGRRPEGPVRLLTHLAYGGHRFNPVSFFYCHDRAGGIEAVVAEINNTPRDEQHCYVLDVPDGRLDQARFEFTKQFHVSPFLPMEQTYRWRFTTPADTLAVHMVNLDGGHQVFDASLSLRRRELSRRALAGVLLRYPLMTVHVVAAIYWQAFRLWRKGCPYFPHPKHSAGQRCPAQRPPASAAPTATPAAPPAPSRTR